MMIDSWYFPYFGMFIIGGASATGACKGSPTVVDYIGYVALALCSLAPLTKKWQEQSR